MKLVLVVYIHTQVRNGLIKCFFTIIRVKVSRSLEDKEDASLVRSLQRVDHCQTQGCQEVLVVYLLHAALGGRIYFPKAAVMGWPHQSHSIRQSIP